MVSYKPTECADDGGRAPTSRRTFLRIAGATAGLGLTAAPAAGDAVPGAEEISVRVSPTQYETVAATLERLSEPATAAISLEESETTAGFREFASGDVDVLVGSRPILAGEHARTLANDVGYESREVPTAVANLDPPASSWTDCLRPSRLADTWGSDGAVDTWAEVPSDGAASLPAGAERTAGLADANGPNPDEVPALVRGVRSHQYAAGFGGVGYYEPDPDWFGDAAATPDESTELVRLSHLYGDRRALDRPAVGEFLDAFAQRSADVVGEVPYYADPLGQ